MTLREMFKLTINEDGTQVLRVDKNISNTFFSQIEIFFISNDIRFRY